MNQEATGNVFYIDRCLGRQVASTLSQAGLTVIYHDDEFPQNALDIEWLPQVGERGWIVLTKDAKIGKNAIERLAVTCANIRLFTLGRQNLTGDEMAEIFLKASVPMQNCNSPICSGPCE
ncbi:MAG: hypothetical protein LRZ84_13365 [Desertifilum sp.]|nr:hypothetical protein [Desertifilum sp.]